MKVRATQYDILDWLQINVGPLFYTSPIMEWYGQGWHVRAKEEFNPPDNFVTTYYDVNIYDEKKAFIFALKWS